MDANTTVEDILNLKKSEIQQFLRTHKCKVSGSKLEIAQRACELNRKLYEVEQVESKDDKKESCKTDVELPSISELNSGWTSDLSKICISHKVLESFLITSRTSDKQEMKCYRQYIRGFNFFKEGYIHKIMNNKFDPDYVYVRSKCFPSMKSGNYSQWILLKTSTPVKVLRAECTCPAGLGEGCTHVAALLFFLEANGNVSEVDDIPTTSQPCQWNKPSKRKHEYEPVSEIKFKKFKYGKENDLNNNKINTNVNIDRKSFFQSLCGKLSTTDTQTNPVLFSLYTDSDINTNVPTESDLNVSRYEEVETGEDNIPNIYKFLYLEPDNFDSSSDFFNFVKNIPHEDISVVEKLTCGQLKNPKWVACRKMRITASNFHDVITRQATTDKLALKFINSGDNENINTASLAWGRKHEPIAKKRFLALQRQQKKNSYIQEVGIFLCPNYGFLGASPDGILIENTAEETLIEVKCPYKWRNSTILEACSCKDFYLVYDNDTFRLKRNHRYFTQIQGQMFVSGVHTCKLIIYTLKDIVAITINYDAKYCSDMLSKLESFYKTNVLPIIFGEK